MLYVFLRQNHALCYILPSLKYLVRNILIKFNDLSEQSRKFDLPHGATYNGWHGATSAKTVEGNK